MTGGWGLITLSQNYIPLSRRIISIFHKKIKLMVLTGRNGSGRRGLWKRSSWCWSDPSWGSQLEVNLLRGGNASISLALVRSQTSLQHLIPAMPLCDVFSAAQNSERMIRKECFAWPGNAFVLNVWESIIASVMIQQMQFTQQVLTQITWFIYRAK